MRTQLHYKKETKTIYTAILKCNGMTRKLSRDTKKELLSSYNVVYGTEKCDIIEIFKETIETLIDITEK